MDAILKGRAEQLAHEMAGQVTTLEDLTSLMRSMMKTALGRRRQVPGTSPAVGLRPARP